jgi:ComF family protein
MWLRHCLLCERLQRHYCCQACWKAIAPYTSQTQPPWSQILAPGGFPCISYAPYTGEIQQLLYLIKYHGFQNLARELGQRLGQWYLEHWPLPEVIVPVPLHPERERERGYNQSFVMATALGRILKRPVISWVLRAEQTPALYHFNPQERMQLLSSAFILNPELKPQIPLRRANIALPSLLIVDDILTTGSTLNAVVETLLPVSARQVALTLARADITDPLAFQSV